MVWCGEAPCRISSMATCSGSSGAPSTKKCSGVFCSEFDLHMYCGHARMNGTCTHCGPDPKMNSKKAIKKRSFDDLFGELN